VSLIEEAPVRGARLLHFPQDITLLRRVAESVPEEKFNTPELRSYCQLLGVTMLTNRGAGLAATQIDGEPCWRVVVIGEENVWMPLCNPEVVRHWGTQEGPEGCLSFASVREKMEAPAHLVVQYRDPSGLKQEVTCGGFRARAVWHETQHLDGKLIIDRMGTLQRRLFLKTVDRARRAASPS
jgi:peptide deformylase